LNYNSDKETLPAKSGVPDLNISNQVFVLKLFASILIKKYKKLINVETLMFKHRIKLLKAKIYKPKH
jgi:hypothetical protein